MLTLLLALSEECCNLKTFNTNNNPILSMIKYMHKEFK